ncbi:MAG: LytTR family DNA-binding domain-containing protein [Bacteroidota bacterium]
MLKAIIVDDESKSRNTLKYFLSEYCPQVEVIGLAADVLAGIKEVITKSPDVVFLDIDLPNYSGFKLVEYFDNPSFQVVFTTAYEQYAMQAFKASATGYLLKPINIDELIDVVKRVERNVQRKKGSPNKKDQTLPEVDPSRKIDLPTKNGMIYLTINEILYLKADGRNTHIFFKNNESVVTTLNMKECDKKFLKTTLLRIHKSHMINLSYIKKYLKKLDAYVEMEGGQRLDVGQAFKGQLNQALSFFAR